MSKLPTLTCLLCGKPVSGKNTRFCCNKHRLEYFKKQGYMKVNKKAISPLVFDRYKNKIMNFYELGSKEFLTRTSKAVKAKKTLIKMLYDDGFSFCTIGEIMNLDHATVCYHYYHVNDEINNNIKQIINGNFSPIARPKIIKKLIPCYNTSSYKLIEVAA